MTDAAPHPEVQKERKRVAALLAVVLDDLIYERTILHPAVINHDLIAGNLCRQPVPARRQPGPLAEVRPRGRRVG